MHSVSNVDGSLLTRTDAVRRRSDGGNLNFSCLVREGVDSGESTCLDPTTFRRFVTGRLRSLRLSMGCSGEFCSCGCSQLPANPKENHPPEVESISLERGDPIQPAASH